VLHAPLLTWNRSDARVVRRILARQRARRWVVIIDEPAQAEHLRVLTAALWYRGRAIPLAWIGVWLPGVYRSGDDPRLGLGRPRARPNPLEGSGTAQLALA
jgi:hypothetical protein